MKVPVGPVGPAFTKKILPKVEVFWHAHKRYPSETEFMEMFKIDLTAFEKIHASKFYLACLKERGISVRPRDFTEKQVAAIHMITNVADKRPNSVKLESIGVTPEMYNGWMQNPVFKEEIAARADEMLGNIQPFAMEAFSRKIQAGDINALKMYFEMTGKVNSPEMINVKAMMTRVIEAVQKHVKDPAILRAIADEVYSAERLSVAEKSIEAGGSWK